MAEIKRVTIQIRRPMGDDAGEADWCSYTVEGGMVTLVDDAGKALPRGKGAWSRKLREGEDAERAARELLWARYRATKRGSDFNRRLNYPDLGIV